MQSISILLRIHLGLNEKPYDTLYVCRDKILREVFSGEKYVCLAITEAFAGSDVAGLKCTATKSEDGKYWIVNVSEYYTLSFISKLSLHHDVGY